MQASVDEVWDGPAFDAFERYCKRLREVTILEANRLALMGDSVLLIADRIEEARMEADEQLLGVASLVMLAGGLVSAGMLDLILAAGGAAHMVLTAVEQEVEEHSRRVEGLTQARLDLESPAIVGVDPSKLMTKVEFPDDAEDLDDWKIKR